MGKCKYCGLSAGFFRWKHAECEQKHLLHEAELKNQRLLREKAILDGRLEIITEVQRVITSSEPFEALERKVVEIEQSFFVPTEDRKMLLIKGWENTVEQFLDDGILDSNEESRLMDFKEHFALSQDDLDGNGSLTKTTKAAVLGDVLNGIVPQRMNIIDGSLPINFQKGEQLVWAFSNTNYYEDKTRRQYVGGSQGVSVRVMKGVYYRVGAFKGEAVEHTERIHVDTGWLVVTNKNLYFAGPRKALRLPYTKIVSFEPFSDGIGVMKDTATAKPQVFVTGDGWFTYNLVTNISQI